VDEVSWEDYGWKMDENLESLVARLKIKGHNSIPAKRVYIPKGETKNDLWGYPHWKTKWWKAA
jgi:hypothetical protein